MTTTVEELEGEVAAGRLRMPTYAELVEKMRGFAKEKGEWAGIPVPMGKEYPMSIEPRYPYRLDQFYAPQVRVCKIDETQQDAWMPVNEWYSKQWQATVVVQKGPKNRSRLAFRPNGHGMKAARILGTLGIVQAWLPDAETKANTKLWGMIGSWKFQCYVMTGTFIEQSKRSGVFYLFRKLRPTLALRPNKDGSDMRVLCGLCLHPIGYYHNAWGGVMTPTDDVISHLAFVRGDEAKFWANANQHAPEDPLCGI